MTNIISSVQKSVLVKSETPVGQVVQRVIQDSSCLHAKILFAMILNPLLHLIHSLECVQMLGSP